MPMSFGSVSKKVVATKIVAIDGSGDYTDIQTAINALPVGGGVVYIKEGTYSISESIILNQDNIALIGAGKATKIQSTEDVDIIYGEEAHGTVIEDLYVYGYGAAGSDSGIKLIESSKCRLKGIWAEHCGDAGIYLQFNEFLTILDCRGISNAYGLRIRLAINNPQNIIGCTFSNNSEDGVFIDASIYVNLATNIIIENTKHGIHINNSNVCTVNGNIVDKNDYGNSGSYDGIFLLGADRNIIVGNKCGANDRYGINISNANCDNNIVDANQCQGNTTGSINDAGTGTVVGDNYAP